MRRGSVRHPLLRLNDSLNGHFPFARGLYNICATGCGIGSAVGISSGDMGRKDILFKGKVLSAKIDCHTSRQQRAMNVLRDMLARAEHAGDLAVLHYELFLFSPSSAEKGHHRRQALELYRKLYADTPNAEYQERITELAAAD